MDQVQKRKKLYKANKGLFCILFSKTKLLSKFTLTNEFLWIKLPLGYLLYIGFRKGRK